MRVGGRCGPLLAAQAEGLGQGGDCGGVGEGEAEDHFFGAGLDVTRDQTGDLVGLADGESGGLLGRGAAMPSLDAVRRKAVSPEVLTFLAVGGAGYVVDVSVFNLLRSTVTFGAWDPSVARVLAVGVAMVGSGGVWARGFGFVALIFACVNIFGGFLVTQRMLAMYKKKAK